MKNRHRLSCLIIKGLNRDVGLYGMTSDKTDGIDRCISTYLKFSMTPLLIKESVGELHHDNCTLSLLKRIRRLATPDRNNASKAETWKS